MKQAFILNLFLTTLLLACSSTSDANKKNFEIAINKKPTLFCTEGFYWSVNLKRIYANQESVDLAKKMNALVSVGLVRKDVLTAHGKNVEVYSLTTDGEGFLSAAWNKQPVKSENYINDPEQWVATKRSSLCFARENVAEIIKWDGPKGEGAYKEAVVKYKYKLVDIAPWANNDEIKKAFPFILNAINNQNTTERVKVLKLSSEGWELK